MTIADTFANELWCVHVIGPDDIFAFASWSAANDHAKALNAAIQRSRRKEEDSGADMTNWPEIYAAVEAWSHSAESHAEDLARGDERFK